MDIDLWDLKCIALRCRCVHDSAYHGIIFSYIVYTICALRTLNTKQAHTKHELATNTQHTDMHKHKHTTHHSARDSGRPQQAAGSLTAQRQQDSRVSKTWSKKQIHDHGARNGLRMCTWAPLDPQRGSNEMCMNPGARLREYYRHGTCPHVKKKTHTHNTSIL